MSPLVSCLLLVFVTSALSGVVYPQGAKTVYPGYDYGNDYQDISVREKEKGTRKFHENEVARDSGGNRKNNEAVAQRVKRILSTVPLIDGHNDLPNSIRFRTKNNLSMARIDKDLSEVEPWAHPTYKSFASNDYSQTDLVRLKTGMVGGQFWAAYMDCDTQYKDAVQTFLEQVDLIHQLVREYPDYLQWADSADGIEKAFAAGKIASLVGVESGHAIGSSLAILRTLYKVGARYLTLTHNCNTPWADSSKAEEGEIPGENKGLSEFGERVVLEMNRLGMMVDLSHVSSDTMRDALRITKAPVIFSHSGARAVTNHTRNVPDDVLEMVKENGGIVMAIFGSCYVIDDCANNFATVGNVVKHINHIRKVVGIDHVGIGSDYNGVKDLPVGLKDVSGFPKVFETLIKDKTFEWTDEDLEKLAGRNILRVFRAVEKVRDDQAQRKADNKWIDPKYMRGKTECRTMREAISNPNHSLIQGGIKHFNSWEQILSVKNLARNSGSQMRQKLEK